MGKIKQTLRPSPTALLNPRIDPAFKGIFTQGTEQSELALKSFLSAMIGRNVVEVTLQPNEPPVDTITQKQMSFDVSVKFDDNELADIEMQGQKQDYDLGFRSEGQVARLLNSTIKRGDNWQLSKVYQITIINFEYDKDDKSVLSWYTMKNSGGHTLGDRLNIIYLDLHKIKKLISKPKDELKEYEKWGLFFAYEDDKEKTEYLREIVESEKGIMAAHDTIKHMSENEENWAWQLSYETAILDRNTIIHNATERGKDEGLKQGMAQQKIEDAINLYKNGVSLELIAKSLKMTVEEVEKIVKKAEKV